MLILSKYRMLAASALCLAICLKAARAEKKYMSSGEHSRYIASMLCPVEKVNTRHKIQARKVVYGKSKQKRPLVAYIVEPHEDSGEENENVYIIGAQHGDERNTVRVLDYFVRELKGLSGDYRNERRIIVIPLYNPDGYKRNDRYASGKIDLNRDFPSSDGAKGAPHAIETRSFMRLMKKYPASLIYNMHQPFRTVLYYPEDKSIAKVFSLLADYPLGVDVGYPTPGSLGTWARENKIPIITVEMARSMRKSMAPFIYEEVRLALFHGAFGCIPRHSRASQLEKYLAE